MKKCKTCNKEISNKAKKCKYCGTKISAPQIKKEEVQKIDVVTEETKTEFLFTQNIEKDDLKPKEEKIEPKKEKKVTKKEKITQKREIVDSQLAEFLNENYILESEFPEILFANTVVLQKKEKTKPLKVKIDFKEKLKSIKLKDITKKDKSKKSKKKKIVKKEKEAVIKLTKAQAIELAKKKIKKQKIVIIIIMFVGFFGLGLLMYSFFPGVSNLGYVIKENTSKEKRILNIGEKVTYKGVSYTITKVETSMGTKYKKPQEGNHFLIITIDFKNNSDDKYRYSSEDWTMTNSLGEESKRIISPVNAGKALYSGYLVVGAKKTASIVFEQPKNDPELKIHYYEPVIEEEKEITEDIEESDEELKRDPIFSVIIVIPKSEDKQ